MQILNIQCNFRRNEPIGRKTIVDTDQDVAFALEQAWIMTITTKNRLRLHLNPL